MKVDIETKFNVGDFVVLREAILQYKRTKGSRWENRIPNPFQVIEIMIQYCYGGAQVHYRLRAITSKGASTLWDITEPELELYREEDYVAVTKESDQPSK